jgi:hypothetical protein
VSGPARGPHTPAWLANLSRAVWMLDGVDGADVALLPSFSTVGWCTLKREICLTAPGCSH